MIEVIKVRVFQFLMPGEVRVFSTAQASETSKWIIAP
jgi:hypothetical protein